MEEIEKLRKAYEEQLEINKLARLEIEKEEEQRRVGNSVKIDPKPVEEPWKGKFNLMNLNEDPFLTGKIRHVFKEGDNVIGKSDKEEMPDIVIGGVGVLKNHCRVNFDGTTVTLSPNPDPNAAKVFVNGKLVAEPVTLAHNDRVLFGSHNYFVFNDPSMPENSTIDWDYANKEVIQDQLKAITSDQDEVLRAKLKEMEEKYESERRNAEEEAKKLVEERRLALEKEYQDKIEKLQSQGGSEGEVKKLQQEMKEKGDQAVKAVEEDIQKKNAKELNRKKKLKDQAEFRMKNQKEIEEKLAQVIPKINEVNEMCLQLGRLDYLYSPTIVTEIEGNQMKSKVCVKIYPDHSQNFFNQVDMNEFMEKYYLIQERFQNYEYDVEHNEVGKVEDTGEDDTVTFGIAIRNDWVLIGQAHIYTDSIANLLETLNDHTPLIDSKGNLNGKFCVT